MCKWIPTLALCLALPAAAVDSLTLLALFEGKAMIHIDGRQRLLHTGETSPEGVTLISADSRQAVVEVDGEREVLQLGLTGVFPDTDAAPDPAWAGPDSVSLWADQNGFFYVSGLINGYPVRFLVDTGATTIAMNSRLAARIGIDYQGGKRGLANTAGGVTEVFGVELDTVEIGGIRLHNVEAGVINGTHPTTPLLGMSFLGELDMVREGNRMELKRRY